MCRSSVGHTEWPYYEVCRLIYGPPSTGKPVSSVSLTVMSSPADDAEIEAMTGGRRKKKPKSHNNALILVQQYFRQPNPLSYEHAACFSETYLTRLRLPPAYLQMRFSEQQEGSSPCCKIKLEFNVLSSNFIRPEAKEADTLKRKCISDIC